MDMGARPDEHTTSEALEALEALIEAAAPDPVPADHALALLRRLEQTDPVTLGRLAYHALTGVAPGEGDPEPPSVVAPGFPPFAAEVLMRAICGPDHRRPTAYALLIVLDTVPLASWPGARLPQPAAAVEPELRTISDTGTEPAPEPGSVTPAAPAPTPAVRDEFRGLLIPSPDIPRFGLVSDHDDPPTTRRKPDASTPAAAEPKLEPDPEPDPEPVDAPAGEPAADTENADDADGRHGTHDEFRAFVSPSFAVPRFEPLEGELPVGSERVRRRRQGGRLSRRNRRRRAETRAAGPVKREVPVEEVLVEEAPSASPVLDDPTAEEPSAEEPEPEEPEQIESTDEADDSGSPEPEPEPAPEPAPDPETTEPVESSEKRRGGRGRKDRAPRQRHTVAHGASEGDRLQTLVLVAVILVLIVLGIVYAASQGAESADDPATPQGASRSISQPAPAAE